MAIAGSVKFYFGGFFMKRKSMIFFAAVIAVALLSTTVFASTSMNNANALNLYMYKGQVQGYIGYPDSTNYNSNYRRNLEFFATPDGYDVYQIFVGFMSNGQLGVLGNVYRPGRTSTFALANQLRAKGLTQINSNANSLLFQGNDARTGRLMYAIVEDWTSRGMGPVVTLITSEVYQRIM